MNEPVIEHDVPLPDPPGWAAPLLRNMNPGDSCVIESLREIDTLRCAAARQQCQVTARRLPNKSYRFWLVHRLSVVLSKGKALAQ